MLPEPDGTPVCTFNTGPVDHCEPPRRDILRVSLPTLQPTPAHPGEQLDRCSRTPSEPQPPPPIPTYTLARRNGESGAEAGRDATMSA